MCHLITDPSKDVQKMAYQLLHAASRKRTEYLVIEAGVDSEAAFEARLPAELLGILDRKMNFDQLDEDEEQVAYTDLSRPNKSDILIEYLWLFPWLDALI